MIRNPNCTQCPLSQTAPGENRCVLGKGLRNARVMVVTKTPVPIAKIRSLLTAHGLDAPIYVTAAAKCRTTELEPTSADIKACRTYLDREIDRLQPEWILALGNEALLATTGHSGIMKHRGKIYPRKENADIKVVGTLNPAALRINPAYQSGFTSDIRFFSALVNDIPSEYSEIPLTIVTEKNISLLLQQLETAYGVSFDLETTRFEEYFKDSAVISIGIALWNKDSTDVESLWAIPLFHPESEFKKTWKLIFSTITSYLKNIKIRVAQNAKFDCRWTVEFGEFVPATFCTMIAAHLIDENRSKSLESLTRELSLTKSWKIDTKNLLDEPLEKVLPYNATDALNTARIYFKLRQQLKEYPKLVRLFKVLMMPLSNEYVFTEREGAWIDRKRLNERWAEVIQRLKEVDAELMKWVPAETPYPVNFNPSYFLKWWVFTYLKLPVLKETDKGQPSLDIATKYHLEDKHPAMGLLIERSKLTKLNSCFFSAYDELLDDNDRVHTTFHLARVVTGRLSSGKGDSDKVLVKPERSVNLHQVPKDPFVRGVFGAPPGWYDVDADFSQIEFRIAAMLANDETALEAFKVGKDIHRIMAAAITKKPESQVTKEERSKAKPPNFLFLFGGYEQMFIDTAWREYQIEFTMHEAKLARQAFFNTWTSFEAWHESQRKFVHKHGYVTNLLGRVRRLPNIRSRVAGVRLEAERQAINSPVQSLASELTQLSYVILQRRLRRLKLPAVCIGTVHDNLRFAIREDGVAQTLPIIKQVMENLPLMKLFNVELTVPIKAEISIGHHWGEGKELTDAEIHNWNGEGA